MPSISETAISDDQDYVQALSCTYNYSSVRQCWPFKEAEGGIKNVSVVYQAYCQEYVQAGVPVETPIRATKPEISCRSRTSENSQSIMEIKSGKDVSTNYLQARFAPRLYEDHSREIAQAVQPIAPASSNPIPRKPVPTRLTNDLNSPAEIIKHVGTKVHQDEARSDSIPRTSQIIHDRHFDERHCEMITRFVSNEYQPRKASLKDTVPANIPRVEEPRRPYAIFPDQFHTHGSIKEFFIELGPLDARVDVFVPILQPAPLGRRGRPDKKLQ